MFTIPIFLLIGTITAAIILRDIPTGPQNINEVMFTATGIMILWPILFAVFILECIIRMLFLLFTKNPLPTK